MGRVSKRLLSASVNETGLVKSHYKAGIYARLSSDQDVRKNESVEVQIRIAEKYVEQFNQENCEQIDIADRYIDLGKTGSNFNRGEFQRLMQDIRLGDINCVIVKDLSRFGRNYLEAGNYIEKIFPFLGVRFIAITDGVDTGSGENDKRQTAVEIKNLINDMYVKDFSMKAKQSKEQRRKQGSYVGGIPPYGYISKQENRVRKLVPDENTREIVEYIFKCFVETGSYTTVVKELNKKKINPPMVYRNSGEVYFPPDTKEGFKGWKKDAVKRIVKSETYIGNLVQGKSSITAGDEADRVWKDKEKWIIKENAQEPLVDKELFLKAQKICKAKDDKMKDYNHPADECMLEENIFDKVLYCGVCGKKMVRNSRVKTYADGRIGRLEGYFCADSIETSAEMCPEINRITKTEITSILMTLLKAEFAVYLKKPKKYMNVVEQKIYELKAEYQKKEKGIERAFREMEEGLESYYIKYKDGTISQKEYADYRMHQQEKQEDLNLRQKALEEKRKKLDILSHKYQAVVRSVVHLKKGSVLTKEMAETLIDKIYVYPGKRAEFVLAYADELLTEVFDG